MPFGQLVHSRDYKLILLIHHYSHLTQIKPDSKLCRWCKIELCETLWTQLIDLDDEGETL